MGYFSFNCKRCGVSLKAQLADAASWQKEAVIIPLKGQPCRGDYDGYGNVVEILDEYANTSEHELTYLAEEDKCEESVYHAHCWDNWEVPIDDKVKHAGPSDSARDQGFFIIAGDDYVEALS